MIESVKTLGFSVAAMLRPKWGRAHMEAYQLKRLRDLVRYAMETTPLYRERYQQAGVTAADIRTLEDLQKLPLLGKRDLRTLGEALADRPELIFHRTSGSTGVPTCIYRTHSEERRLNLFRWRMRLMNGLRPGDRIAHVKTVWEPLPDRYERLAKLSARTRLVERRDFDCLQPFDDTRQALLAYRPTQLIGYPGALVKLARNFEKQGGGLPGVRRVFTGGEYLAPHQRRQLEQFFQVPVTDCYGTAECNLVAWQCEQTGAFHICDDGVLVEVCRDGVPVAAGEEGDVVISVLQTRTMPLIRYSLGDRAVAGESQCRCGAPFSTIESLQGRVMEYLVQPDGQPFHPLRLVNEVILAGYDFIAEYQMIQETKERFRLLIVPLRPVGEDDERALQMALGSRMAGQFELRIEWVEDIPPAENGKFRFCRTEVESA